MKGLFTSHISLDAGIHILCFLFFHLCVNKDIFAENLDITLVKRNTIQFMIIILNDFVALKILKNKISLLFCNLNF